MILDPTRMGNKIHKTRPQGKQKTLVLFAAKAQTPGAKI
jgi:hypothetical protein